MAKQLESVEEVEEDEWETGECPGSSDDTNRAMNTHENQESKGAGLNPMSDRNRVPPVLSVSGARPFLDR
jgi:hypothetical protein